MKKRASSTGASRARVGKREKARSNDPFAVAPNPLGKTHLAEERPIRATRFASLLPAVYAKYGIGRKLGVERFLDAWRESLAAVFSDGGAETCFDARDEDKPQVFDRAATFATCARPTSFRGGVLRVELNSNLLLQEFHFHLPTLLREMQRRLPDEKIRQIKLALR